MSLADVNVSFGGPVTKQARLLTLVTEKTLGTVKIKKKNYNNTTVGLS